MAKLVIANMRLHLDLPTTSLTTLWRIVRADEQVFYFTEHDVDVPYDGNVYSSDAGYSRSAISNDSTLSVDSLDIEGVFDSAGITKADLRAGLFDFAEVYVSLVNWKDPDGDGIIKLRRGWFGEVEITQQGTYRVELRGMAQALSQKIVNHYQAECPTDLGSPLCKVPIDPPIISRLEILPLSENGGDVYRKVITGTPPAGREGALGFINGGFETADLTGWAQNGSVWDIQTSEGTTTSPAEGTYFANMVSGGPGSLSQVLELRSSLGGAIADAQLLTGNIQVAVGFHGISQFSHTAYTGSIIAVDSSDVDIGVVDTATVTGSSIFPWTFHSLNGYLPSNTAKLRFDFAGGSTENVQLDGVSGAYLDDSITVDQTEFENKIYKVITAGVTALSQPVYDETVGNPTTDGTAILEAVDAWSRDAVVAAVTSNKLFSITVTESRDVDGWFQFGGVVWTSGNNSGRVIEVKTWTQTGALIDLYLTMPFDIQVGDKFTIYPGCDKAWSPGDCVDKFDNGINFRGHPFIIGEDEAAKIADSRTGGAGGGITGGGGFDSAGEEFTQV